MIDFVSVTITILFHNNIAEAVYHGVNLVILDGLCLGLEVSDHSKLEIVK
jgi:hypothetical protein